MADAIVATDLVKRYPGGVEAVRGVSLRVAAGEIVGLLGPNGAGKSTTLNMLATLVAPTAGEARIFGHPATDRAAVRPLLGVALQATGVDPMMSVRHHFEVQAALQGLRGRRAGERSDRLIEAFALGPVADRRAGALSGGTRRRLSLALALLHGPRAIIFDEPTVGLDPGAKRAVWALLGELRDEGLAILFSTHQMDEADHLCQRIEVIAAGRIVATGTPAELKSRAGAGVLAVRLREGTGQETRIRCLAENGGPLPSGPPVHLEGDVLRVHTELLDPSFLPTLACLLERAGADIVDVGWGHGTLDDVLGSVPQSADGEEVPAGPPIEHRVHARRR
jgi:ABC-2 type transport system ATP-binding protein